METLLSDFSYEHWKKMLNDVACVTGATERYLYIALAVAAVVQFALIILLLVYIRHLRNKGTLREVMKGLNLMALQFFLS